MADLTALDAAQAGFQWYFGPLLRVEDFPANVLGGVLNGGVGVAPGVDPERSAAFREAFVERWDAETTLDAHYLYDTMTVLLLGLRDAAAQNSGVNLTSDATYAASCAAVPAKTTGGAPVGPVDALSGDIYERATEDLDYTGLSGPIELGATGSAGDGLVEIWRVRSGGDSRIETVTVRSARDVLGAP